MLSILRARLIDNLHFDLCGNPWHEIEEGVKGYRERTGLAAGSVESTLGLE